MNQTIGLGRFRGIHIGANWSLLVVFWLIAWSLATVELPDASSGHSTAAYWIAGIAVTVIFYGCLLAHELAHALLARQAGIEVRGIVLWLFGGVSQFEGEAATPSSEFRIAVAGPATSVILGLGFLALAATADTAAGSTLPGAALAWLGWINLILAVFNLAPAFPLDGGRILRSLLWRRHGDKTRATATAGRAGRGFAYVLIAIGLLEFLAGGVLGGVWLALIGWFLMNAGRAEALGSELTARLAGIRVRDVMTPHPIVVSDSLTVDRFLEDWLYPNRCSSFPLVDPTGTLTGLITLARVKRVAAWDRSSTQLRDIACRRDQLVTASPDEDLLDLLRRLSTSVDQRAVVVRDGHIVGIVSPTDVTRAMQHLDLTIAETR